jgi:hypothetical protein
MWSDPPATAEDWFCSGWCTDTGLQRLNTLLDDPANDTRPFDALSVEADAFQRERYIRARLAPETLKTYPIDNATDPGFLRCEPWGLARNVVARHQLEIRQRGNDRLEMRYGEWDARRTVYLDNRPRPANQPPTPMGHSTARYERDAPPTGAPTAPRSCAIRTPGARQSTNSVGSAPARDRSLDSRRGHTRILLPDKCGEGSGRSGVPLGDA